MPAETTVSRQRYIDLVARAPGVPQRRHAGCRSWLPFGKCPRSLRRVVVGSAAFAALSHLLPSAHLHAPDRQPHLQRMGPPLLRQSHRHPAHRRESRAGRPERRGKIDLVQADPRELQPDGGEIALPEGGADRLGRPGTPRDAGQRCWTPCWRPTSSARRCICELETRRTGSAWATSMAG